MSSSMENNNTDEEDKCRMLANANHHAMVSNNSQPHSAIHTPTLLQPIQSTVQSHEIMPQLSSAMPFMLAHQNMADLTGIKLEPLAGQDASSLLGAGDNGISNSLGAQFGTTNPTGWMNYNMNMFGNYQNTNFGFPAYNPYSTGSTATGNINSPYDQYTSFTQNYCMPPMPSMPRTDLSKFQ